MQSIRAELKPQLTQSKYVQLLPEDNLTQKQKAKLEEIRQVIPSLAQMHLQKETFRAIFERAENWRDGAFQLLDWLVEAQGEDKVRQNGTAVYLDSPLRTNSFSWTAVPFCPSPL